MTAPLTNWCRGWLTLLAPVAVLSGDDSAGVAEQFVMQLKQLRAGVTVLAGSQVAVRRDIALLDPSATVIADRPAPVRTMGPRCPRPHRRAWHLVSGHQRQPAVADLNPSERGIRRIRRVGRARSTAMSERWRC